MPIEDIQTRFNSLIALGDSLLQVVELKTGLAECRLVFDFASLLKADGASVFDPETVYQPACLAFFGVRSVSFEGMVYQLNSTVVGHGAAPASVNGFVEFYFDLTGGTDPDAFMARMKIVARDFSFGSVAVMEPGAPSGRKPPG